MKRFLTLVVIAIIVHSSLQAEYTSDDPKKDRFDFIKGWCLGFNVECPLDSVDKCWTDDSSRIDLSLAYDWLREIVTHPSHTVADTTKNFITKRLPHYLQSIKDETINCDSTTKDYHLMKDKIGLDLWSEDWMRTVINFANSKPQQYYSFMSTAFYFIEKKNYEAAGAILGLKNQAMVDVDKDRSFEKSTEL